MSPGVLALPDYFCVPTKEQTLSLVGKTECSKLPPQNPVADLKVGSEDGDQCSEHSVNDTECGCEYATREEVASSKWIQLDQLHLSYYRPKCQVESVHLIPGSHHELC